MGRQIRDLKPTLTTMPLFGLMGFRHELPSLTPASPKTADIYPAALAITLRPTTVVMKIFSNQK